MTWPIITLPYYCPGGKNGKIKTIRFLGTVRSLFCQNTSSARKKKQKQGHYFYKESMEIYSSGGNTNLFLTGHNSGTKIVAINGFQCFTPLDTHFQTRHFLNNNLKFYFTAFCDVIFCDVTMCHFEKLFSLNWSGHKFELTPQV